MRNANILLVCSALLGLAFYFTGEYLMRLYGFDPPYVYHKTGLVLVFASFLCFIVGCLTLLFILWRKLRNRNN